MLVDRKRGVRVCKGEGSSEEFGNTQGSQAASESTPRQGPQSLPAPDLRKERPEPRRLRSPRSE